MKVKHNPQKSVEYIGVSVRLALVLTPLGFVFCIISGRTQELRCKGRCPIAKRCARAYCNTLTRILVDNYTEAMKAFHQDNRY